VFVYFDNDRDAKAPVDQQGLAGRSTAGPAAAAGALQSRRCQR